MKTIFWLLFFGGILAVTFLFGNTLRCESLDRVNKCPDFCYGVKQACDSEFDPGCEGKFNCKPIKLEEYPGRFNDYFSNFEKELKKVF